MSAWCREAARCGIIESRRRPSQRAHRNGSSRQRRRRLTNSFAGSHRLCLSLMAFHAFGCIARHRAQYLFRCQNLCIVIDARAQIAIGEALEAVYGRDTDFPAIGYEETLYLFLQRFIVEGDLVGHCALLSVCIVVSQSQALAAASPDDVS